MPEPSAAGAPVARAVPRPEEFLRLAGPLFEADEARHDLILALAWLLVARPEVYPEFRLWVAQADGAPVAAALITPPFKVVLADADPAALPALAAAVAESGVPVPGAIGNRPTIDRFNDLWAARTGVVPRLIMGQGVFAVRRVRRPPPAPGAARPALPDDRALILDWLVAFNAEALPGEPDEPARRERAVDHRLDPEAADAGFWLWEDGGEAVSLVGFGGPTPGGARLGPVYTPLGHRRRGYGAALVAAVSAWLLDHGRRRCFLHTDLANPTSNAIYRRVGYEQVAEAADYSYREAD